MAFVGRFCDMQAMFESPALQNIYAYLTRLSDPTSPESKRVCSTQGEQKIQLDSLIFAIEQSYALKSQAEAIYETHKQYVDVQYIVQGQEHFHIANASECTIQTPYDDRRDVVFYAPPCAYSTLRVGSGMFAVFFPYDVHSGGLGVEVLGTQTIYKSVIKIPTHLLQPRF